MPWFVIHRGPDGTETVTERRSEEVARAEYRELLRLGWPETRMASVYKADSQKQLEDHLEKRVQIVCFGSGDGYWDSPEGQAQRERDAAIEERDCLEDIA